MSFVQPILPGGVGTGGEGTVITGLSGLVWDASADFDLWQDPNIPDDPVSEWFFEPWVSIDLTPFDVTRDFDFANQVERADNDPDPFPYYAETWSPVAVVLTDVAFDFDFANQVDRSDADPDPFPYYAETWTAVPLDLSAITQEYDDYQVETGDPDPEPFAFSFYPDLVLAPQLLDVAFEFPAGDQRDVSDPDPDPFSYYFDFLQFLAIDPSQVATDFPTGDQMDESDPDPDPYDYSFETWVAVDVDLGAVVFEYDDYQVESGDLDPDAYDYSFETWAAIPADTVGDVVFDYDLYQVDCSDPDPDCFSYTHEVWIRIPVDVSDVVFDFPAGDQVSYEDDGVPSSSAHIPDSFEYVFEAYDTISINIPGTSPCIGTNLVFVYDAESPLAGAGITPGGAAALSSGNGYLGTTSMRVLSPADYFISSYMKEMKTWSVDLDLRLVVQPSGGNLLGFQLQHVLFGGNRQIGWYVRPDLRIGLLRDAAEIATSDFQIAVGTYYNVCFLATIDTVVGTAVISISTAGGYATYINFSGNTQPSGFDQANYMAWGHLQPFGGATIADIDNITVSNNDTPFVANPGTPTGLISTEIVAHHAALGVSPGSGTDPYMRTQFAIDPAEFDGFLQYSVEGVISNPGPADSYVQWLDSTPVSIGTVTATSAPDWQRFRTAVTPLSDDTFAITSPSPVGGGTSIIDEARIIIDQVGGTKQTVYFPFLSSTAELATSVDSSLFAGDIDRSGNHLASGNYRDWFVPSGLSFFKYVAAEWDQISFFRYQALIAGAFSGAYSLIYNVDTGEEIEESLVATLTYGLADPAVCTAEFSTSLLVDGNYGIKVRSDHPSRNAFIYGASLDIVLNPANKSNVYWRYGKANSSVTTLITSSRFLLNKEAYSQFRGFIETTALSIGGGYATLQSDGTEDTGTNFLTEVYALAIDTTETVYRSVDISSYVTSGNRYIYRPSTATTTVRAVFFVAQSSTLVEIFAGVCVCPGPVAETILRSTVDLETTMLECRVTQIGTIMETIVDVPKC